MTIRREGRFKKSIPEKSNTILNILLLIFALMALRIWHLSVVQYESRVELARRPRERVVIEPAERASIYDRFGLPVAQNRIGYQACLIYAQLTEIPSVRWKVDAQGNRVKRFPRREHITNLANLLAEELALDPRRVEDEIHAKAALYYQRPYVFLEGLTEQQYYRLRMLEREWTGLHVRQVPIREYPNGRIGSHVVGYVGAINREEYEEIAQEIKALESYLFAWEIGEVVTLPKKISSNQEVFNRLEELKKLAYTARDTIGKTGVEAQFEEELRGFQGRRRYYADARGNFLKLLSGEEEPQPGKRLELSLSIELQELAEKLLIESEGVRDGRSSQRNRITGGRKPLRQPWVKGGAIIAMEPISGEVVAMASLPRYDPNDFVNQVQKKGSQSEILRWLEADRYLSDIWDGKRPEIREIARKGKAIDDERWLDWETYLGTILPDEHPVREQLKIRPTLADAIRVQGLFEAAIEELGDSRFTSYDLINVLFPFKTYQEKNSWGALKELSEKLASDDPILLSLKSELGHYLNRLEHNYDKVLFLDLCRLSVDPNGFSDTLVKALGKMTLDRYRYLSWSFFSSVSALEAMIGELFHELDWSQWKDENGKRWLKEQRAEEKALGRYSRPYLDLYDKKEKTLFKEFWQENRWTLFSAFLGMPDQGSDTILPYIEFCREWHQELVSGAHRALPWVSRYQTLLEEVKNYNSDDTVALFKTMRSFNELTRPLWGRYRSLRRDAKGGWSEQQLAAAFYPRYGYGSMRSVAYRHYCTQGSIFKILTAYEALSQRLNRFEGSRSAKDLNPFTMQDELFRTKEGWNVGRWESGEPIPRQYKGGRLPRSYQNLGRVDIVEALAHSANPYFAILAVDYLENPSDLAETAKKFGYGKRTEIDLPGEISGRLPTDLDHNVTGLYSLTMGQHSLINTPLQTCVMLTALANGGFVLKPQIEKGKHETRSVVAMPDQIQRYLFEGMRRAVNHSRVNRGGSLPYVYRDYPSRLSAFLNLEGELIGKSSTTEQVEVVGLDLENGTNMYNHIWFGGVAFPEKSELNFLSRDALGVPELAVVVYLPFGGYGKESLPIVAELVSEWRKIKKRHADLP